MLTRGRSFSGRERNCVFLNTGSDQRFADVSAASGLDLIDDGRAVIANDWDHDGDIDLWFTNREAPRLRFFKNQHGGAEQKNWLAFELTGNGNSTTRDAIGAVLELEIGGRKLTRSLTAGDGFMSQSSKRIHFGLGGSKADQTGTLTVRWPGGKPESFEKIPVGSAYQIAQGSGTASPLAAPATPVELAPSQPAVPAATEQARIVLSDRIASPPLDYVDFRGELQRHESDPTGAGAPLLINLWASWCAPCRAELADFKTHHQQLRAKGLRLLAFTVEGVPRGDQKPDVSGAKKFVADSAFPFEIGAIDANGLRLLTLLHDRVIVRQRPLPLPSSFLLDKYGRLAAIYKGPVSAAQLLTDLDLLDAAPSTLAKHSFPFPARDGIELFPLGALDFASAYLAGGDANAARGEARKVVEAPLTENAQADLANRARAWYFLGTLEQGQRNWAAASEAYQTALDFAPEQVFISVPLGVVQWQAGEHQQAEQTFSDAATTAPTNAALMDALGKAQLQIKRFPEAIEYFTKAIALAPQVPNYQLDLGLALQTSGDAAGAVQLYREFLEANPGSANAKNNLANLLATTPSAEVRDGAEALKLAREVIEQAGEGNPAPLSTLAAALAESGDFDAAVATTEKAIAAARATGRGDLLPKLRSKLALFREGKPYHSE
ncbi:MAG: tetratricopeptide (TPR) repeat protein [Verrucomicrobiales bacterium]|jgi:tetratricopeptide (TPR) repeat protein